MLKEYLLNSEKYWEASHARNSVKLQRFLKLGSDDESDKSIEKYVNHLICLGKIRSRFNPKHVYIINPGSSGSHWLEAMLGILEGFYNGGEIYIPKKLKKHLSLVSTKEASRMLDTVYLAHVGGIYKDSLMSMLSNSAHLANHHQITNFSLNKTVVLLLRNPVDVVISRTFRKNEYKKDIAPLLNDKEYLEKNCTYVESFYSQLDVNSFDAIVRYEDFVDNTLGSLKSLVDLIGIDASENELERAVSKTSRNEELNMLEKKGRTLTNIYVGERDSYEWAKSYVRERLNDILVEYKYIDFDS